jgi:mono/diheme cytochrome c family protein
MSREGSGVRDQGSGEMQVSGVGCQVSGKKSPRPWHLTPDTWHLGLRATTILGATLFLTAFVGCRQEMYDQPKYKPLAESKFFADHRTSRPLPDGTVARGWLRADQKLYEGKEGVQLATTLPVPLTRELLSRGRERFDIYCSPCHDRTGRGRGMVVRRGYQPPPSLHEDRLREAPVGHFVDVITHGLGAMPDYAAQIEVSDRWAIAAYVKALQLSQRASLADVPLQMRSALSASPVSAPAAPVVREMGQQGRNKPVVR